MIVLVHEIHDKWPNVTHVQYVFSGFDHANRISSLRGSKYLPNNGFGNAYTFEYENWKRFG